MKKTFVSLGVIVFAIGILITAMGSSAKSTSSSKLPVGVIRNAGWTDTQLAKGYDAWSSATSDTNALCEWNDITAQATYAQFEAMNSIQLDTLRGQAMIDCHQ
jgi:hypothetical protein